MKEMSCTYAIVGAAIEKADDKGAGFLGSVIESGKFVHRSK